MPLLEGEIRSCFGMTEPDVAPDATNIATHDRPRRRRVRGQRPQVVEHRRDDARCKVAIVMGVSDPDGPRYAQHSMILVPLDAPGVRVVRDLTVFGYHDQHGHGDIALRRRARAGGEPDRRGGRRLRDRPGAARPRPHPPLHARDRDGRARARADGRSRASRARSAGRSPTRGESGSGSPSRGSRSSRRDCSC